MKTKNDIYTPHLLTYLPPNHVFVFGSSLLGKRKAGAAWYAKTYFGAEEGVGEGLTGDSYALPTISADHYILTIEQIKRHLLKFFLFAHNNQDKTFWLTEIGCGIAGYSKAEIAQAVQESYKEVCKFVKEINNIHYPQSFIRKL